MHNNCLEKHEKTALKRACILHCAFANKKYSQRGLKFFFIFSQLGFLLCSVTCINIHKNRKYNNFAIIKISTVRLMI